MIALSDDALADDVLSSLQDEGYDPIRVSPNQWLTSSSETKGAFVCVVFAAQPRWEPPLPSAARQLDMSRSVCVVPKSLRSISSDLFRNFADFITWPCSRVELRARLARVWSADGEAEGDISGELAGLSMIGESPVFRRCVETVRKIAATSAPVVIQGETGTGKELAARAIHYLGRRSARPFIPVNCGAIPDTLIETELFGHVRGAFTDAKGARRGVVAQADEGTLFLDEVDSLTPRGQVSLLRFLQDYRYRPVGAEHASCANVRVVAAANRDLEKLVASGQFRDDLLFRLSVLRVRLPPLRARHGDIERLASHFLKRFCAQYEEISKRLDPCLLSWMQAHDWPGNVRELENFVHRAFILSHGPMVRFPDDDLTWDGRTMGQSFQDAKARAVASFEKRYLTRVLLESSGNVTLAAKRAGKERRALGRLIKKHGIRTADFLPERKRLSVNT